MSSLTGEQILAARARHHWTQADLAGLAGVSPSIICRIETGHAAPHVRKIGRWTKILIKQAIDEADEEAAQKQGAA